MSFTFDDFPRTALTAGGAILEKFGARGTFYVAVRLMGSSEELGEQCHAADLQVLLDHGHELGHQTYSHISSRSVSCSTFCEDVWKGQTVIESLTGSLVRNFAYPYGEITVGSKRTLGPALASSRSNYPGLNGPDVDLNLLKANRIYGDIEQSAVIEKLILENVKRKSWLIFYTHDVRPDPSPYGCTVPLFEHAVSFAAQNGSRILTIGETLEELGVLPAIVQKPGWMVKTG